jgi:hypothetical protein
MEEKPNISYTEANASFRDALLKDYERKNINIGNISPEDKELITVKDLTTAMEEYIKTDDPKKTIADFLGL